MKITLKAPNIQQEVDAKAGEKSSKKSGEKAVFAGNLGMNQQDQKAEQLAAAKKKSLKMVVDQFKNDEKTTEEIGKRVDHQGELETAAVEDLQTLTGLKETKAKLQQESGVTDPSMVAEYDEAIRGVEKRVSTANDQIAGEVKAVRSIINAEVKDHPMVDAGNVAEAMLDAAAKTFVNQAVNEAKETTEDEMDATKKEAQEAAKKDQEVKEQTESNQVDQSQSTATVADAPLPDSGQVEDMMSELKKLIVEQNVLPEDAKGILLDENI